PDSTRARESVLESRKQFREGTLSTGEQGADVSALRHTVTVDRIGGHDVESQHQHPFEVVGERPRGRESSHPGPNDYRLLSDRARHHLPPCTRVRSPSRSSRGSTSAAKYGSSLR